MGKIFVVIGIVLFGLFLLFQSQSRVVLPLQVTSENETVTLLFGGDVMLGRTVTIHSLDTKKDPIYPFTFIKDTFLAADISLVNLETPILTSCPRRPTGMIFCAPTEMLRGLTESGIDIVTLANNHTKNYGEAGLTQTKQLLEEEGIKVTGVGTLTEIEKAQTRFGFIGFDKDQQSNPVLTSEEKKLVTDANATVDILVVSLHWGVEYKAHPTEGQRRLARELVALGADVIVGHHPHWVQDHETISGVPVYYSLGNLVFDQMWSEETKKGLVVKLTFENKKQINEELLPVYMKNHAQPQFVSPQ
ncbi:CapA family protein [Candidatus Woesebacteria bacterium]|nr:CapA family protein [Candidatus Woesebacteria bacterium]